MRYNRLLVLASAVLLLFSACSGSRGLFKPDFERFAGLIPLDIDISLSYGLDSGNPDVFSALAEEFSNKNEYGIAVNILSSNKKTADAADLAIINPSGASELVQAGKSLELSPLIYHPEWGISEGSNIFFKAARRQTGYPDFAARVTSVPLLMDAGIMIINNRILDDAGFRRFPETWTGMKRLLRKSGAQLHRPAGMELDADSVVALIQARGGSILRPFGLNYSLSNSVVNRTLRALRRYEDKQLLSVNQTKYINQTDFVFGRLLAVYTGIDGITAYDKMISLADPELDWGIALLPTTKPGDRVTVNPLYTAVVFNGPPQKQLASWLFIKWLTENEQQIRLSAATGSLPAVTDALSEIIRTGGDGFPQKWLDAAKLVNDSKMDSLPGLYDYNMVSKQIEEMVDRIFGGSWVWLETIRLDFEVNKERRRNSGR